MSVAAQFASAYELRSFLGFIGAFLTLRKWSASGPRWRRSSSRAMGRTSWRARAMSPLKSVGSCSDNENHKGVFRVLGALRASSLSERLCAAYSLIAALVQPNAHARSVARKVVGTCLISRWPSLR
jgi:hypothetical protein